MVAKPLFNGNIASMLVNLPKLGQAQVYGYGYDQLNRIVSMDAFTGLTNTTNVLVPAASDNYKERITYDANGNIQTYLRNGETASSGQLMDNLKYQYERDANGNKLSNKLRYVLDLVQGNSYSGDLKTQSTLNETQFNNDKSVSLTGDNYRYDKIGNLTKDNTEGITNITWSVYGKILSVSKSTSTITYTYDGTGNRISKMVNGVTTWYVRDATGNVMAVYEKRADLNSNHLTQTEVHLYGSSRLGILTTNRDVETAGGPGNGIFERGNKSFELSNHLENVLATVSDRRVQVSAGGINVDYYLADVLSASDNYPFGMQMPGRDYSSNKYRYGFNGKEKDNEIKGEGNQFDYGERVYDPRTGRFYSVDPMFKSFPELTTYQYGSNNPIFNIDLDGLEGTGGAANSAEQAGKTTLTVATKNGVEQGGKVIAIKATEKVVESPGFWSKFGTGLLKIGSKALGVVSWVLTPLDAGPRFPHGDEMYYHHPEDEFKRLYPNDPVPKFLPKPNPTALPNPNPNPGGGMMMAISLKYFMLLIRK